MKEVLRAIVKMADIGLVKPPQLIELMAGVKIIFRSGKAETVHDGQYIMIDGRKHRFDTSEIRGILIHRDESNPEAVRKLEGFTKIEVFMTNHMATANKHNESTEDCAIRILQSYMQSEAGNRLKELESILTAGFADLDEGLKVRAKPLLKNTLSHEGSTDDRENPTEKAITSKPPESPTPNAPTSSSLDLSDQAAASIGQPEGSNDG